MASFASEGFQFNGQQQFGSRAYARQFDSRVYYAHRGHGHDFFTSYDEVYETYDAMGLENNLLKGIHAIGCKKPSTMQQRGIVPFCLGHDVVIQQQQSGIDGKTATFCIGILHRLDYSQDQCQAIVLTPTTDLAKQIYKVMRALGGVDLGVKVHACDDERSFREDDRILSDGVHVVVGTPGQVFDLQCRRPFRRECIKMFVLDEVDEMLYRGYKDQIYRILNPINRIQVAIFSATMPPEAIEIARRFTFKPVRILVQPDLDGVLQFYVNVDQENWKLETLCDIYETLANNTQSVIFVNTQQKADWLTDIIRRRSRNIVSSFHGDMDHNTRDIIMSEFRSGSCRVLITTDLLVRDIVFRQVSLVINYDLPTQPENYLRHIGHRRPLQRSGQSERNSVVINFVTHDDERMLYDIQRLYNMVIRELPSLNVANLL
ncbi:hypothetical protein AQUCO_04900097v1 [Aquilegia coerulea]|uniref:RNA helicase n=1 Tax=Aquilegia coerulea TaxID=218851 RepID=A0A2G5CJX2_AQUCA|nr:hypothetical protein AQUCO_04900097v1 [Aquilegia coerulea]